MYNPDAALAAATLAGAFAPGSTSIVVDNTAGVVPGSAIVRDRDFSIVYVSGTTNPQQWALQVVGASTPAFNAGAYSTVAVWYNSAQAIIGRINAANLPAGRPIVLAGDSYGGAVATIVAAELLRQNPGQEIILITFGAPRPGDARLYQLLTGVKWVNVVNDGDPVPRLPPVGGLLTTAATLGVPSSVVNRWAMYQTPPNRAGLSELGNLYKPVSDSIDATVFANLMAAILGGGLPALYKAHDMKIYLDRLNLAGPDFPR